MTTVKRNPRYWDEYAESVAHKGGPFVPQSYIDEMVRGYTTGEYSHHTRDRSQVRVYADRNGELHVLCHEVLEELERLGADPDVIHGFRERLHNVPQSPRPPSDE